MGLYSFAFVCRSVRRSVRQMVSKWKLKNAKAYELQTWIDDILWPVDDTCLFWGQGVKGQGHIDLVGKNGFQSITKERLGLGTSNLVRWLFMTCKWLLLILGLRGSNVKVL
jgi:hypothetical protein